MPNASDVKDILTSMTGAPFKVTDPAPNRLLLRQNYAWFVANLDLAYLDRTAHLDRAWEDRHGAMWLETSEIADMIALVEREYGEKGATSMPDVKVGTPPTGGIPEEVMAYPRVVKLLRVYEDVVARLSKEHGVELKMLYDGGVGVTTVRIGAKIGSPSTDAETLRQQIGGTAKVLEEAYGRVMETKV
jgi:hypothetical protein